MRGRWLLAKGALVLATGTALAQTPPLPPTYPGPVAPQPPGPLPPLMPSAPVMPQQLGAPAVGQPGAQGPSPVARSLEIPFPQKENKIAINSTDVSVKFIAGSWKLWMGQKLYRDFGNGPNSEADVRAAALMLRNLRPTEWVVIGGPKPIVEYGLVNGRPPIAPGKPASAPGDQPEQPDLLRVGGTTLGPPEAGAKTVVPIDLRTVRAEAVRGAWCLRDDNAIHFNFGPNKQDADQAAAVVQRYGFNRVGVVGSPVAVMHYLFVSSDAAPPNPYARLQLQAQIDGLTRVGIPVGGVGFVGEMIKIDPRKLEVRKDGADWVVASGTEIIGRYGQAEWVARDAVRTIQDSRFTEFCKVGSGGLTFFLVNGKAPDHVPFATQGRRFNTAALKVQKIGNKWAVTENARHLLDCANADEGETLIRVLKHFQFDQLCHLGPTPQLGVSFLAKGR